MLECHQAYKCITLTLNNLGLLYKQTGKLSLSARYFKQILEIEQAVKADLDSQDEPPVEKIKDICKELASTLINLCSLYSAMHKHEIALRFARRANQLLEGAFLEELRQVSPVQAQDPAFLNLVQVIATSYHNTGVEFEHLRDYAQTLKFYLLAFSLANRFLGADHPLCKLFQSSFAHVKSLRDNSQEPDAQQRSEEALIKGKIHPKI